METRIYNIEEVLNSPEGTEFVNSKGYKVTVNEWRILCYVRDGVIKNDVVPLNLQDITDTYKLLPKKLNFFEAMKLIDEGKTVYNSRYPKCKYKKVDEVLQAKNEISDGYKVISISDEEITADWFEVIE